MTNKRKVAGLALSVVVLCSIAAGQEAARLQFRPEIGQKQTMRMTSRLVTTNLELSGQDCTTHAWTLTVELEPLSIAGDGSVTLRVAILRAQYESSLRKDGTTLNVDSDEEKNQWERYAGDLMAFRGESFTIIVSARGELLELNTGDFYRAIVRNRMQHEERAVRHDAEMRGARWYKNRDERTRRRLIEADAETRIRELNEGYGSREKREQAYKDEAPESWFYGTLALRILFNNVLTSFGPEPVRPGDRWTGPVMVRIEAPMELGGTYTFKGVENGVCAIEAQATRNPNDRPFGPPPMQESQRVRLTGAYQATIQVDQGTGSLLRREAVMELKGTTPRFSARTGTPGNSVPIKTTATVIVEPLR